MKQKLDMRFRALIYDALIHKNDAIFDHACDYADQAYTLGCSQAKEVSQIPEADLCLYEGYLKMPAAFVRVSFEADAHASQDQKDLAFFKALCKEVEVDYLALGSLESKVG